MVPKQKGKQGTKGSKQIVEDNKSTLNFYRNMGLGSVTITFLINFLFFEFSTVFIIMSVLSVAVLFGAYQFMLFMSRAKYSETGQLLDPGNDLNLEGGVAEHVKDLIILTANTMLLTLLSNYFWYLLLLAPGQACWLVWSNIIKPRLSQKDAVEDQELDPKKQKKMERKMRRMR